MMKWLQKVRNLLNWIEKLGCIEAKVASQKGEEFIRVIVCLEVVNCVFLICIIVIVVISYVCMQFRSIRIIMYVWNLGPLELLIN
jgi:hypothetical protein